MTKLKENLIAFIGALALTGLVIFVLNHNLNLSTDVLGATKQIDSDLKLIQSGDNLLIKSNKKIENVASVTFQLAYNPEKIKLTEKQIQSPYDIGIQKINPGNYYIMLTNVKMILPNQVILEIKNISKQATVNINFGHIQVISNNGNILNLILSK